MMLVALLVISLTPQPRSPAASLRHRAIVATTAAPADTVVSWYDQGLRLRSDAPAVDIAPAAPDADVAEQQLTQALIRAQGPRGGRAELVELGNAIQAAELAGVGAAADAMLEAREFVASKGGLLVKAKAVAEAVKTAAPINADEVVKKDVGTAVGLIAGLGAAAAVGVDLASIDLDILAAGVGITAAVLAEEDEGIVGSSLRAVGNVANPVFNATSSAAQAAGEFYEEKEVGWYARAVAELGFEATAEITPEIRPTTQYQSGSTL